MSSTRKGKYLIRISCAEAGIPAAAVATLPPTEIVVDGRPYKRRSVIRRGYDGVIFSASYKSSEDASLPKVVVDWRLS